MSSTLSDPCGDRAVSGVFRGGLLTSTETPSPAVPPWRRIYLISGILFSVTVLQRFAVPFADSAIGWGFVLCLALSGWALLTGVLRLDPTRLVLYALAIGLMILTLIMKSQYFSLTSLIMLMTIYMPFIYFFELDRTQYFELLHTFQSFSIFVALSGAAQFGIQFVLGSHWMFPFDALLPPNWFVPKFNLEIPIFDGSHLLKSTGIWFLEPSIYSQMLGFAIIVEIAYFNRTRYLMIFAAAYLVSFSGTGFLLIAALIVPVLMRGRHHGAIVAMAATVVLVIILRDLPVVSIFFDRTREMANPLASGSMRFLAPYWWLGDVFFANPEQTFLGFGPGNVEAAMGSTDYAVQDSSWLKLIAEYGIIGAIPFLFFYVYALFYNSPDRILSSACLFQFLFLGGYLNAFYLQFFFMAIVGWPRIRTPSKSFSNRVAEHR